MVYEPRKRHNFGSVENQRNSMIANDEILNIYTDIKGHKLLIPAKQDTIETSKNTTSVCTTMLINNIHFSMSVST